LVVRRSSACAGFKVSFSPAGAEQYRIFLKKKT
jgi:hypothetical protein